MYADNDTRQKQKLVACSTCNWKTKRVYNPETRSFGSCCNKQCNGAMRKVPSHTQLKREAIYDSMMGR